jgi:hypothetical protein
MSTSYWNGSVEVAMVGLGGEQLDRLHGFSSGAQRRRVASLSEWAISKQHGYKVPLTIKYPARSHDRREAVSSSNIAYIAVINMQEDRSSTRTVKAFMRYIKHRMYCNAAKFYKIYIIE